GHTRSLFGATLAAALAIHTSVRAVDAADATGEHIFQARCASCHGSRGEGTDDYPRPLAGDRSLKQRAQLIAQTTPEGHPGTRVGEEADRVAAYIYDAFYSRTAQARNKPARIELSRLTVRQYRNAVADLIGNFRTPGAATDAHGLKAAYFKSYGFRPTNK